MKPLRNLIPALSLIVTLLAVTLPARADDNQLTRGEKLPTGEYRVGGAVTAPREVYAPDPEYTDEARKANYQGTVVLWLVVDANGRPQQIRVQRPLGMGLDEKAIEAVRQWKFEPARKDGQAVPAMINLEITFRRFSDQQSTLVSTRPGTKSNQFPGVDRMKYPYDVLVLASRTQYQTNRNVVEMAVQIWDGQVRKSYTIRCSSEANGCGLLTAGTYAARWRKGKLEVVGWRMNSQKLQTPEYTIVAENCETPFTCK